MRVIGTAGHVDHGKSTLVEALTGMHPDRLKEEREREMTIDLGFAWMTLPGGEDIGIVDVPGHRDFIENMLAGVGGIDAVLLVVASDEGVMPQTKEHLAIIDLLQVQSGIIVITKTDLVDDSEWLELVESEIHQITLGTVLANAPLVRVSARNGQGLAELIAAIEKCLSNQPARPDHNRPRLPIDRIFTITGFGTVVTGTLLDGSMQVGDEVEILPQGARTRIRGLQTHKKKEDIARPGSRTAVNLTSINTDEIQRGNVLTHIGDYLPTRLLDLKFRLLPGITQPLKHRTEVKLYLGAAEIPASLRLLGSEELFPGQEGWLQLELSAPVVAMRGDHYILRRPSPGETLGGGLVIDPHPKGRHKRFAAEILTSLESLAAGTPVEVFLHTLTAIGAAQLKEISSKSTLSTSALSQALKELCAQNALVLLDPAEVTETVRSPNDLKPEDLITSRTAWNNLSDQLLKMVKTFHHTYPLRTGIPREELRSRIGKKTIANISVTAKIFNQAIKILLAEKRLEEAGNFIRIPGHTIQFSPQQEKTIAKLMQRFHADPGSPPSVKECLSEVGEDIFIALLELEQLIQVAPDVVFQRQQFDHMVAAVRKLLQDNQTTTAAQIRDYFNTSRRYALAFLEYLDATGVTVRNGDIRKLK